MGQQAGTKSLQVLEALRAVTLPSTEADIVTLGLVQDLVINEDRVQFTLALPGDLLPLAGGVKMQAVQAVEALSWVAGAAVEVREGQLAPPPPPPAPHEHPAHGPEVEPANALPEVKHVIAVGSGKGGVGKSTVAVNLALALAAAGQRVGLLDADVYGPSVPLMLGISGHPLVGDDEKIIPAEKYGLKVMSMGLLLKPDQAVVWRGPMVHGVVQQFLSDVQWGELDFLVVDLPPGTGDAPLSLTQALPLTAAVAVTTPQDVAASIANKAMSMFDRMGIRVLGLIENMSYFTCPDSGKQHHIFGEGGGRRLAAAAGVPFLGEVPIDPRMCEGGDTGSPIMVAYPQSELAGTFRDIATRLMAEV
jgi:ATP-binding protein involved in chromosome partitioning